MEVVVASLKMLLWDLPGQVVWRAT